MEQQVARRGDGMAISSTNLPEGMQLSRARRPPKEPVPRIGPKAQDARETRFQVAKSHRAQQRRKIAAEGANGRAILKARIYCGDQEDRGPGERRSYRLHDATHGACGSRRFDGIGGHWMSFR
jgi:hypothetical protein